MSDVGLDEYLRPWECPCSCSCRHSLVTRAPAWRFYHSRFRRLSTWFVCCKTMAAPSTLTFSTPLSRSNEHLLSYSNDYSAADMAWYVCWLHCGSNFSLARAIDGCIQLENTILWSWRSLREFLALVLKSIGLLMSLI